MKRLIYYFIFTLGLFTACKQDSTSDVEKQVVDVKELKTKVQSNEHYLAYHEAYKDLAVLVGESTNPNNISSYTEDEKEANLEKARIIEQKMNENLLKLFKAYPELKSIQENDLKEILPPINPMSVN